MRVRSVLLVCCLVFGALMSSIVVAESVDGGLTDSTSTAATLDGQASQADENTSADESNASEGSLGTQMSSFVHSTSAETAGVVETGMWEAEVTRTGNEAAVERRVNRLDERVTNLREQRAELKQSFEAGEISRQRYDAQLAQINGRLNALSNSVEVTERTAKRMNVDAPGLKSVRERVEESRRNGQDNANGNGNGVSVGGDNGVSVGNENETAGNGQSKGNEQATGNGQPTDNETAAGNGQSKGNGQSPNNNPGKGNGQSPNDDPANGSGQSSGNETVTGGGEASPNDAA